SVFQAIRGDEGVLAQVALKNDEAVVDDRGTAKPPFVLLVDGEAGIDGTEVSLPEQLAFEVVAIQSFGSEAGENALAVRRRGALGLAPLEMPFGFRHSLKRGPRPEDLAGGGVEAQDLPGVLAGVIHRSDIAIVPGTYARVGVTAESRGHEHPVTPDDRAGVAQTRDRRLPPDVRPRLNVPGERRVLSISDPRGVRPTQRGPMERRGGADCAVLARRVDGL